MWEQLQLRNKPLIRFVKKQTNKLIHHDEVLAHTRVLHFIWGMHHQGISILQDEEEDVGAISGDARSDDEEGPQDDGEQAEEEGEEDVGGPAGSKDGDFIPVKHNIDDEFLNLDEMNAFLDEQVGLNFFKFMLL